MRSARLLLAACTVLAAGALAGCEATQHRDAHCCGHKSADGAALQHASADAGSGCLLNCDDPAAVASLTAVKVEPIADANAAPVHAIAAADAGACKTVCDSTSGVDAQVSYAAGSARGGCVRSCTREITADPQDSYAVGRTGSHYAPACSREVSADPQDSYAVGRTSAACSASR